MATVNDNLMRNSDVKNYLRRFNAKIRNLNFQEAYIVGSTPLASDWLSDTDGGTPITPEKSKLYVIKTSGSYENFVYTYDGTSYVQPVAGADGGYVKRLLSSWITNKKILDKFTEDSDGNLLYNGKQVFLSKPESTTENTSNN